MQALVNGWAKSAAPRTVRRRYGVLASVFAYAVGADWLGRSPCHAVKLPPAWDTRRQNLGPKDVGRLAEAMPEDYAAMVWVGAVLGLRWSEVAGLRVGALDFCRGELQVVETVTRDGGGNPVIGPPKSAAGARTLAIPVSLVAILSDHLNRREVATTDGDRLVFEAPEGGPIRYNNWRRRVWLPATVAAGCRGAGFHDLRRAAATVLVSGGVDVRTAQARLGHSDPRMTLAIYAQVVQDADRRAADAAGAAFRSQPDVR